MWYTMTGYSSAGRSIEYMTDLSYKEALREAKKLVASERTSEAHAVINDQHGKTVKVLGKEHLKRRGSKAERRRRDRTNPLPRDDEGRPYDPEMPKKFVVRFSTKSTPKGVNYFDSRADLEAGVKSLLSRGATSIQITHRLMKGAFRGGKRKDVLFQDRGTGFCVSPYYISRDDSDPNSPEMIGGYGIWDGSEEDWLIPDGYLTAAAARVALQRIIRAPNIDAALTKEDRRLRAGAWRSVQTPGPWKKRGSR